MPRLAGRYSTNAEAVSLQQDMPDKPCYSWVDQSTSTIVKTLGPRHCVPSKRLSRNASLSSGGESVVIIQTVKLSLGKLWEITASRFMRLFQNVVRSIRYHSGHQVLIYRRIFDEDGCIGPKDVDVTA